MSEKWWSYEAYVDTGFSGAEYIREIDIRDYFSKEDWDAMSKEDKNSFFEKEQFAEDLLFENIESCVRHTKNKEECY